MKRPSPLRPSRARKVLAALCLPAWLGLGCALHYGTMAPESWVIPEGERARFDRDFKKCHAGASVPTEQAVDRKSFEWCMQDNGWKKRGFFVRQPKDLSEGS